MNIEDPKTTQDGSSPAAKGLRWQVFREVRVSLPPMRQVADVEAAIRYIRTQAPDNAYVQVNATFATAGWCEYVDE